MRDLSAKFFAKLHIFIILYLLYGVWTFWDEHSLAMEQMNSQLQGIESSLVMNTKRLGQIQEFIKKRDEYQLRVEEVAKNIEAVQKQLPPTTNDTEIISFFNQEMNSLNIKESNLIPGVEGPSTYFIAKNYDLKAKGTFLQFLIFFERISTASRIYNISEFTMKVAAGGRKGRFQMLDGTAKIQAYRYNPDFTVDRGFTTPSTEEVGEP